MFYKHFASPRLLFVPNSRTNLSHTDSNASVTGGVQGFGLGSHGERLSRRGLFRANRTNSRQIEKRICRGYQECSAPHRLIVMGQLLGGNSAGRADGPASAAGQCGALTPGDWTFATPFLECAGLPALYLSVACRRLLTPSALRGIS